MSTITLVRHGQASAGTDNYDRLSERGQLQARHLGDWWKKIGVTPTHVFAGTLERQQHTAQLVLEHLGRADLNIQTVPELNEYSHHEVDRAFGEGKHSDGALDLTLSDYHGIMQRWRDADATDLANMESWQNFMLRGMSAVQHAHATAGDGAHSVLFTSGGVVATLLGHIQSLPFEVIIDYIWDIRNSSVTTLRLGSDKARVVDFNRVSHLDFREDPSLITLI